ncbi:DUF4252 domain-containing protein [Fulvivirga sp. RKSG066]|uniref:DUF4252 domain-containing protein n=1 Tax=Fulvivirga aurantia TaxID=2529383 RepID=UPI0012BD0159|nr:DUF4252 domain-containing protein [Fulvivirga aurantia]MTI20175.1 DUF4252 domain-containing protein [Fulvivirga aurantia]
MKKILIITLLLAPAIAFSQSKTTRQLQDKYEDAFGLFFYNNTLNMLNQNDDEDFAELIKDIDKMKFLRISKAENDIGNDEISELIEDYKDEDFEDLMNMRHEGMNVQVYIQEDDGVTTGLVFLMTDDETLSILDVKGKVPMNQLASLISKVKNID